MTAQELEKIETAAGELLNEYRLIGGVLVSNFTVSILRDIFRPKLVELIEAMQPCVDAVAEQHV